MIILYSLSIFFAVWMGLVFIGRVICGLGVRAMTMVIFSASVMAIITHAMGIWG